MLLFSLLPSPGHSLGCWQWSSQCFWPPGLLASSLLGHGPGLLLYLPASLPRPAPGLVAFSGLQERRSGWVFSPPILPSSASLSAAETQG